MFYVSLSFQPGYVCSESNEEYNSASYKSKINTNSFSSHLDAKIKRGVWTYNFKIKLVGMVRKNKSNPDTMYLR